ncbi:ribonuclease HII [Sphingosinicella sp. BN140058]|uniref:ribonuclease HII n=1 Tax=Sphingosinicella sp. BN140058 TaxID=1892855 RepID=UPI0010119C98|nr:ribonuclease HII [Sphingosinicella sp. BN140058]QAY80188.1 ribonuclease HII [Sphingosinicella sp. BN140058]
MAYISASSPVRVITVGIDEVGRGCLAGDCWAAAVAFTGPIPQGIRDSKALSAKQRTALAQAIRENALVGLGRASVAEIDRLNILRATLLAMRRAFDALPTNTYRVLVDGNQVPPLPCDDVSAVVGGDAHHVEIGAASIVAKVARDAEMDALHAEFPEYGWATNRAYGTPDHLEALRIHGPTPHHRMSFGPVSQPLLPF